MLTLIGALHGAFSGGLKGFLIGGAIGYLAGRALRQTVLGGLRVAQTQLIDSTFSVKGAICKADSVVTRDVPPYTVAGGVPARVIKDRPS